MACKVGDVNGSSVVNPTDFCWSEVKTGLGIFSRNQYQTMYKIKLPIAVFHIEDIFAKPHHIEMDWKMKSGKEIADSLQTQYVTKKPYQSNKYQKNTYQNITYSKKSYSKCGNSDSKNKKWLS